MKIPKQLKWVKEFLRLSTYYGPQFLFTRTGDLEVFEYTFSFFNSNHYHAESAAGRCYEPATCKHMIQRFAGRKITFLDIGAYRGFFTALVGAMNPENEVYAFEPNPSAVKSLKKNWALNCHHGGCYAIALSDAEGEVPFKGRSMKVTDSQTELRVPAMRLDEWLKDHPVEPDLIKLDVHGSEGVVLFGMQDLLERGGFDLYFELHPEPLLVKYSLKEIVSLLYDSGWQMAELPEFRAKELVDPVPLTPERRAKLEDPARWTKRQTKSRRMFHCTKTDGSGPPDPLQQSG